MPKSSERRVRARVARRVAPLARILRSMDERWDLVAVAGSIAIAAAVASFVAVLRTVPSVLALVALGLAVPLYAWMSRDARRRRALARAPFPERWRDLLEERVPTYAYLTPEERARFERELLVFIGEQHIVGPRETELPEATRVLVAAAAVTLVFGHPGYRYERLRDLVVVPSTFSLPDGVVRGGIVDEDAPLAGVVFPQGPVVLSGHALASSFDRGSSFNVALHEIAHVLDFAGGGRADGVPVLTPPHLADAWSALVLREMARIRAGASAIDPYGARSPAELFAVATEHFFQEPHRVLEGHPELYATLAQIYRQDPAARMPPPAALAMPA